KHRQQLQDSYDSQPDLPMREQAVRNRKLACSSEVGRESPQGECAGGNRSRIEQSRYRQGDVLILPLVPLYARAALESYSEDHSGTISYYPSTIYISTEKSTISMRKLKTAVIGTGFMGKVHAEGIRRLGNVE